MYNIVTIFRCFLKTDAHGAGAPKFWEDFRRPISREETSWLLEDYLGHEDPLTASQHDILPSPSAKKHAFDRKRDAELAGVLTRTEIMVEDFHRLSRESQRVGQNLLDMVRHPLFNVSDIRSETIVHLLRKLE